MDLISKTIRNILYRTNIKGNMNKMNLKLRKDTVNLPTIAKNRLHITRNLTRAGSTRVVS